MLSPNSILPSFVTLAISSIPIDAIFRSGSFNFLVSNDNKTGSASNPFASFVSILNLTLLSFIYSLA
jgi:hypothetical protein